MAKVGVVAHNERYFHFPVTGGVAGENIIETVRHLRHKESHALRTVGEREAIDHIVALSVEGEEVVVDFLLRNKEFFEVPLYAHIKYAINAVNILVEVENITAIGVDKLGDYSNDTRLVGAVHENDCVIVSRSS